VVFVMVMAAVVQTVQVFQMVILMKMNVMYVIMIHLMTVSRIVLAYGVVMLSWQIFIMI